MKHDQYGYILFACFKGNPVYSLEQIHSRYPRGKIQTKEKKKIMQVNENNGYSLCHQCLSIYFIIFLSIMNLAWNQKRYHHPTDQRNTEGLFFCRYFHHFCLPFDALCSPSITLSLLSAYHCRSQRGKASINNVGDNNKKE